MWENLVYELGLTGKFVISLLLGLLVGIERELNDKSAGMRTYSLIAAAATGFVILGFEIVDAYGDQFGNDLIVSDPVRVVQAIVVGVSFVGAGLYSKTRRAHLSKTLPLLPGFWLSPQ